jgi:hypothetical protein
MNAEEYGWANPAPGTRLWRLRTYPETLSDEDARLVAQDLLAHIDALAAKVEGLKIPIELEDVLDVLRGET